MNEYSHFCVSRFSFKCSYTNKILDNDLIEFSVYLAKFKWFLIMPDNFSFQKQLWATSFVTNKKRLLSPAKLIMREYL